MGNGPELIPAKIFLPSIAGENTNQNTYYFLKMAPVMASKTSAVFNVPTQQTF
jgi:hypothetical protein